MRWRATLLASVLLAAPGTAQAFGACDQTAREDADAAFEFKAFIRYNTPVRDQQLAQRIEVEFTDSTDDFGPYVSQDAPTTIRIPRGFTRLSCELTMVAIATIGMPDREKATRDIDDCLDRLRAIAPCLRDVLPRYLPAAERTFASLNRAGQQAAGHMARGAMEFLLLHEFAHIIGRHFARLQASDDPDLSRELEFDADVYAARYATLAHGYANAGAMFLTLLAGKPRAEQEEGSTHDSYYCRYENIANIVAMTELIPAYLVIFPKDRFIVTLTDAEDFLARRRAVLRRIASGAGTVPMQVRFSPECRIQALPQLSGMRRDLLKLAVFQDGVADTLPGPQDGAAVARIMARLIDLPMETADGRAAKMRLLSGYADSYRATWSNAAVTAQIERAVSHADVPDARLFDVSVLRRELLLRRFYYPRGGALSDRDIDRLFAELLDAVFSSGIDPEAMAAMARMSVRRGNCESAKLAIETGFPEDGSEVFDPKLLAALRRELAAAGCR